MTAVNIKNHIFFSYRYISELYSFVSVCVCVKDTCWKFSIYYKFTIKELLKLTKGITWRHSNIVLKLEKIKFTNTLKNNVQLADEITVQRGHKTACLSQLTNRGRRCRLNRKIYSFPICIQIYVYVYSMYIWIQIYMYKERNE